MTATLLETPGTGVTGGSLARSRRAADAAYAQFLLDAADAVRVVHDSPHPDLDELDRVGITITGQGADRWYAALDLVAEEFSRDEGMDFDAAHGKIHDAWRRGRDFAVLWQAVADEQVSLYQARTVERHADRFSDRVATVREIHDDDGNLIDLTADEGAPLFDGEQYRLVLDHFLAAAVGYAREGYTGKKLAHRCSRTVRALTPGYEQVVLERRDDRLGLDVRPCEDGVNAHVGLVMPLGDALRLQAWANAAADATTEAAKTAEVHDARSHGARAADAITDLLRHGLTQHTPATTDRTDPATPDSPAVTGRTHKPATSVQVHVRVDATTLLGRDDDEAWVDGIGTVPAVVARALAADPDATWRKIVTGPGTRDVLDVGADGYRPSAALRRFVVARDEYCQGPGCQVPAVNCDLDHIVPFPTGPTTAQNLRAYCRGHHRFKTQYVFESSRDRAARHAAREPSRPDEPPPF